MIKNRMLVFAFTSVLAGLGGVAACSSASGQCQKEFDCKDQLGLDLQDDYVAVCEAERDGQNNALRQNAEKECKDLANAQIALATCEGTLSCDDLAKERSGGDTVCKSFQDDLNKAFVAADNGAKCTGTNVGEGEGEGEGEGGQ